MVRKTTILIIDGHPLFRNGLKAVIGRCARFEVIGEAGSGHEGYEMAKELKPDLVLIEISLPDQSGIELTRRIRHLLPDARIMIITVHSKIDFIIEAFKAGATGYMVKESAAEWLLHGLEYVSRGDYFLDSSVSQNVVKMLMEIPPGKEKLSDAAYKALTPREQ